MTDSSNPGIGFGTVVLDTDDPPRLAEFYTALLGWQIEDTDDDWITIGNGSHPKIAFQLAINHKPPTWPDNTVPQQFHLDLRVADLAAASAYAESIGARPVEGPDRTRAGRFFSIRAGIRSVCVSEARGRRCPVRVPVPWPAGKEG